MITGLVISGFLAQAAAPEEREQLLFVQNPQGPGVKDGIHVLWIPQPLQKYCLGKTADQCSKMDFCIRTTSKQVSTCQNLPISLARLPAYPADMVPRRVLSVTFFKIVPSTSPIKGMDLLVAFFKSKPPAAFDRLSNDDCIKARIKFTRKPNDDDFDVLEFFPPPPL
jgi:hypothetical protein